MQILFKFTSVSGRGLGPGNQDFFGPCSPTGTKKVETPTGASRANIFESEGETNRKGGQGRKGKCGDITGWVGVGEREGGRPAAISPVDPVSVNWPKFSADDKKKSTLCKNDIYSLVLSKSDQFFYHFRVEICEMFRV